MTSGGRAVAALAMIAGVGLFGAFTGFVASWFVDPSADEEVNELQEIREQLQAIQRQLDRC